MVIIETTYHGPTNKYGSRVTAETYGAKILTGYDDDPANSGEGIHAWCDSNQRAHLRTVIALCKKQGWTGNIYEGKYRGKRGLGFVLIRHQEGKLSGLAPLATIPGEGF